MGAGAVYQSGTRLKMRTLVTADGARAFLGWRDTQLNLDCGFSVAGDGRTRCLPSGNASYSGYFADSACTQPLAQASVAAGCVPTLAWRMDPNSCQYLLRVYAIGAEFTGPTVYVGAACTSTAAAPYGRFFSVGAEVPPSTYVEATEQLQ